MKYPLSGARILRMPCPSDYALSGVLSLEVLVYFKTELADQVNRQLFLAADGVQPAHRLFFYSFRI